MLSQIYIYKFSSSYLQISCYSERHTKIRPHASSHASFLRKSQRRSQSSSVISDVTSPVKLVGKNLPIALGFKPPLVTRIARTGLRTGLGTRLRKSLFRFTSSSISYLRAQTIETSSLLIYARVTRVPPRDFAFGRNPCGSNKTKIYYILATYNPSF